MNPCSQEELLHTLFLLKNLLGSEFGKRYSSDDLSMQEYALLRRISAGNGSADLTIVWEYLAVPKVAVSQMLASLEKRGLLVREIDPANRRSLIVTLTSDGIWRLRQKEAQVGQRLRELLEELGKSDALQFIALINRMNMILSAKKEGIQMTIQEAMRERHMVRKYLEKPIPAETAAQLQSRLQDSNRASDLCLTLVTGSSDGLGAIAKLISKNVNSYIILAGPDTPALDEALGYWGADAGAEQLVGWRHVQCQRHSKASRRHRPAGQRRHRRGLRSCTGRPP